MNATPDVDLIMLGIKPLTHSLFSSAGKRERPVGNPVPEALREEEETFTRRPPMNTGHSRQSFPKPLNQGPAVQTPELCVFSFTSCSSSIIQLFLVLTSFGFSLSEEKLRTFLYRCYISMLLSALLQNKRPLIMDVILNHLCCCDSHMYLYHIYRSFPKN